MRGGNPVLRGILVTILGLRLRASSTPWAGPPAALPVRGQGRLTYEYNMMIIERYTAQTDKIAGGKHVIEVETRLTEKRPLSPAEIVIKVDGKEAARTTVKRTVPAAFTASETFDVGVDLGSPVSLVYAERRPFPFSGKIRQVQVELK